LTEKSPDIEKNCDGTALLSLTYRVLEDEVLQDGTHLCTYELTISNRRSDYSIHPFVYEWEEDSYQADKGGEWLSLGMLGPGESSRWPGTYNTYTDPDASGPGVDEFQRYTGVYDLSECEGLLSDARQLADKGVQAFLSYPSPDNPCNPDK
jgi:hypothetical protein